ncbi:MAG: hypothetical protein H6975_03660 [Gammaproteobacteria bacterium]|nr:hypothetical protein [Gammaproteobacteria bacterium]
MKLDFSQPSTWRGFLGLLTVVGITIRPDLLEALAIALGAAYSLIEIWRDERMK